MSVEMSVKIPSHGDDGTMDASSLIEGSSRCLYQSVVLEKLTANQPLHATRNGVSDTD
jgi:hypothetical protein